VISHVSLRASAAIHVHGSSGLSAAAAEIVGGVGVLIVVATVDRIVGATAGVGAGVSSAVRAVAAINRVADITAIPATDIRGVLSSFPKC
jgi:hypothetical protein